MKFGEAEGRGAKRADIQALRGWAVLLVVLYHAKLLTPAAGFLGVDIFFVISGFVVTTMVVRRIESGTFGFPDFYFGRAKRLLPAAYLTFAVTALLVACLASTTIQQDFAAQLAGAVTFTANVVLWQQTGYFETAAELKPLLHTWSLAIEEQYYLLLPALLVFVPRRWWTRTTVAITAASLLLCLAVVDMKPSASFYLLPTRAWELGLGTVGALVAARPAVQNAARAAAWPALAVLLAAPWFPAGKAQPGLQALAACAATLVLLLRAHPVLSTRLSAPFARLGDLSYSLYLVHWPVLVLGSNVWLGASIPAAGRAALAGLSFLLAVLLHRFVEAPLHHAPLRATRTRVAAALAATAALLLAAAFLRVWDPAPGAAHAQRLRPNLGLGSVCDQNDRFQPLAACRSAEQPRMLVWGDSIAMHLIPGLVASGPAGVAQATMSFCGPTLGVAGVIPRSIFTPERAARCMDFNESVLAYLEHQPGIEVVVLSTLVSQYLTESLVTRRAGALQPASAADAAQGLAETARRIRALGKRVVIIAPPPWTAFDSARCHVMQDLGRLALGADRPGCELDAALYRASRSDIHAWLRTAAGAADTPIIDFDALLCDEVRCRTRAGDAILYRDVVHFSEEGSRWIASRMKLQNAIMESAR